MMQHDISAAVTTEVAAGLLTTGRTLAALEAATGQSSLHDTFAGVVAQLYKI